MIEEITWRLYFLLPFISFPFFWIERFTPTVYFKPTKNDKHWCITKQKKVYEQIQYHTRIYIKLNIQHSIQICMQTKIPNALIHALNEQKKNVFLLKVTIFSLWNLLSPSKAWAPYMPWHPHVCHDPPLWQIKNMLFVFLLRNKHELFSVCKSWW